MMKKVTTILALFIIFTYATPTLARGNKIGILIEKENTATYLETLEGFRGFLEEKGKRYTFIEKNAKNDRETMASLAKEFAGDPSISLILVLGSAAATITNRHVTTKPVIFGGINHPKRLGISGDNITGTTYYIDPAAVVNLIKVLNPSVQKVGILYEPAGQNAATMIEVPETRAALNQHEIQLVEEQVSTREKIEKKTKRLLDEGVEYLIIPTNQLLYSNVDLIRRVTDPAGVPVVSFSRKGVADGALIGITSNNRVLGKKMAGMLIDILGSDRSPKDIAWQFPSSYSILINETTRSLLNVKIPRKIHKIATLLHLNPKEKDPQL